MWSTLLPTVRDILATERSLCTATRCFATAEEAFGLVERDAANDLELLAWTMALGLLAALVFATASPWQPPRALKPRLGASE